MILIVDNTQRKSKFEKRDEILDLGIPCAICDLENAATLFPSGVIVVTEKYIEWDVQYLSALYSGAPVVLCEEEDSLLAQVGRAYAEHCRDICEGMYCEDISFGEGGFSFCGKSLSTTPVESRILKVLMMGGYYTPRQIAAYCLKGMGDGERKVAVHICNINKKSALSTGRKIIEGHRFLGYRMCEL